MILTVENEFGRLRADGYWLYSSVRFATSASIGRPATALLSRLPLLTYSPVFGDPGDAAFEKSKDGPSASYNAREPERLYRWSDEARVSPSRTARQADLPELTKKERGGAYSHSVRGACQQRIVQFIPVRKISLAGAVAASACLPLLLIVFHYLVFVSGTLDWSGHPMSALLNANSPRSLAAWMCSHLWLLCLATTVLTFRLRKHKLDDYDGEYRLWFWLVFTCLIGSIDSTTRLTELFGAALDRWSQLHVGWSGIAIVSATLATLVGLLGLRLCSELKAVPASLVLWLVGLLCWAGSAALSQSMFQLDITPATRAWLRASLWLTGLTSIWLCSLYYLRATFMDAQKRFLSRAMGSSNAVPWRERLREAMPKMPQMPKIPGFRRRQAEEHLEEEPASTKRKKRTRPIETTEEEDQSERQSSHQRRESARPSVATSSQADDSSETKSPDAPARKRGWSFGLGKLALRPPTVGGNTHTGNSQEVAAEAQSQDDELKSEYGKKSGWFGRRKQASNNDEASVARQQRQNKQRSDNRTRDDQSEDAPVNKRSLRDRFTWKRKELTEEQLAEREAKQLARQKAREDKAQNKKSSKATTDSGEGARPNASGCPKYPSRNRSSPS